VNEDSDLREYFASLRRGDEARTPAFEQVLYRVRPAPRRIGGWAASTGLLIAVTAVIAWQWPRHGGGLAPSTTAPSLADWRAPTDFLLHTPAEELLRTVPRFGEPTSDRPVPPAELLDIMPTQRAGWENHS
jgi:hypothetical protein